MVRDKSRKSLKCKGVAPDLLYSTPFVVIVREGCGMVAGSRLMICDRESLLP